MNLVRARRTGLGQDIPDIYDPALQQAIDTGVVMTDAQGNPIPILSDSATIPAVAMIPPPANVPKPSTTVPVPSGFYAPITYAPQQAVPSPAPHVAAPGFSLSSLFPPTGMPSGLFLIAAAVGLALILAPGGRRR